MLSCSAHFARFLVKWAKLAVLLNWLLQKLPQDFNFSIVLGAEYSFYVKFIATYAPLKVDMYNNSFLGSVIF